FFQNAVRPGVERADFRAVIIGEKEFEMGCVTPQGVRKAQMILPREAVRVELILIRVEVRWVYEQESAIRRAFDDLGEIQARQHRVLKLEGTSPQVRGPVFGLHTVLVTIAPVAVGKVHDSGVTRSVQVVPSEGSFQVIRRLIDVFEKMMLLFAGFLSMK